MSIVLTYKTIRSVQRWTEVNSSVEVICKDLWAYCTSNMLCCIILNMINVNRCMQVCMYACMCQYKNVFIKSNI